MTTPTRPLSLLLIGLATLAGCDRPAAPPAAATPPPAATASAPASPAGWPLEVVDGFGRKVTIPRAPLRVVSLAPSNTELMFAVGAGDRLIGRTTVCDYPPEASKVPVVGGMTPKTINLEALVALRPDLILATCGVQEPIIAPLERLKLPVVALDADDFDGVVRNIRLVGALVDRAAVGDDLADRFRARVAAVQKRVSGRAAPRPKVLYLVGEDPLMTAGPNTFIGRMIEAAGGVNIFGDVAARYPRPGEEEILARAPDVILAGRDDPTRRAQIAARPGWSQVPAVRAGRIAFLAEDEVSRPAPRLADGLEAMADALEPR